MEVAMTVEFYDDEPDGSDSDYFYNDIYGCWEPRPEWMHPDCVDPLIAVEHGTCCKYPADVLVRRADDLAEAVDHALSRFDPTGDDCAETRRELARLLKALPGLTADVQAALPGANRIVAAQLLCPIGRLILLVLGLSLRSGCPWACSDHGAPDRRAGIAPLVPLLEECDAALWTVVLPRPRRRSGA
jgi:hypothetical protein